jgi:hypothetical protein
MAQTAVGGGKQERGRPRTLKQGHRVVTVSLDPAELEWIDVIVGELRASGIKGQGPTRSSIIRSAVRRMIEECMDLDLQVLMPRFPSAAFERFLPSPKKTNVETVTDR